MERVTAFWLKPENYDTAVNVFASLPFLIIPALMVVNAPYGRFGGKLGIDLSLNGKWSWCLMEIVSPVTFVISVCFTRPAWTPFQMILGLAWIVHYVNRSIIYPYCAHSVAPIHIFASTSAAFFNLLNGYINGLWIGRHSKPLDASFWFGVSIWVIGFLFNRYHDALLFKLRQNKTRRYFIPTGALFDYVSCPNYFSELVEWSGYSLATSWATPAVLFTLASAANLVPRAFKTHEWYHQQFKDYPKERKAIVPFVV